MSWCPSYDADRYFQEPDLNCECCWADEDKHDDCPECGCARCTACGYCHDCAESAGQCELPTQYFSRIWEGIRGQLAAFSTWYEKFDQRRQSFDQDEGGVEFYVRMGWLDSVGYTPTRFYTKQFTDCIGWIGMGAYEALLEEQLTAFSVLDVEPPLTDEEFDGVIDSQIESERQAGIDRGWIDGVTGEPTDGYYRLSDHAYDARREG